MKTITPQYYKKFNCIAGDCLHSCCIGWEIDIDDVSLEKYKNDKSEFGRKIIDNIDFNEEAACFRLCEDEKCPFLNSDGLCDIIIQKGEDFLCNICADHPRFRNFFSCRTEMGLGMCCEEAARIILNCSDPFTKMFPLDEISDASSDEEKSFFSDRKTAFEIICDRSERVEIRIQKLLECFGATDVCLNLNEVSWELSQCEILDEKWKVCIDMLLEADGLNDELFDTSFWENVFEQLISYFLFRHLPGSLDDGRFNERILFALLGYRIIKGLCAVHKSKYGKVDFEDVCMYCRMFSSEMEYSDENTEAMLDYIMFC